jgi:hypothetical protein
MKQVRDKRSKSRQAGFCVFGMAEYGSSQPFGRLESQPNLLSNQRRSKSFTIAHIVQRQGFPATNRIECCLAGDRNSIFGVLPKLPGSNWF